MRFKNKTFTLIEMLIVIVIIGILAAALVPRLQAVQGRARDSKRKVDLRSIAQALEAYKLDNSMYPLPTGCSNYGTGGAAPMCYNGSLSAEFIQSITGTYITTLPRDPINVQPAGTMETGAYIYYYGNVYNTIGGTYNSYNLVGMLENTKDPLVCVLTTTTYYWEYWGQGIGLCVPGGSYLFEQLPYSR